MIGIIADDTTGANDIGIMYRNYGCRVKVYNFDALLEDIEDCDVLILDTDSRLDTEEIAQYKVNIATRKLMNQDCSMYFNKTCSVFRGNIGLELDTMLQVLEADFCPIVLAYPENGRTTVNGMHYVNGVLLSETAFNNDPVHPMKQSNLVEILLRQTVEKVGHIDLDVVRKGSIVLSRVLAERKKTCVYCIIDAVTDDDLKIIAKAIETEKYIGGSAGIAKALAEYAPKSSGSENVVAFNDSKGTLIISGSLTPQTKAQVSYLIDRNINYFELSSEKMLEAGNFDSLKNTVALKAIDLLSTGKDVLIFASNNAYDVEQTKNIGKKMGLNELQISKRVSSVLSDLTRYIADETELSRLVVAGGDTSGAVCKALDIKGNYILDEIQPGVPSARAIGRNLLIVLKSGSFGKENFLFEAADMLKQYRSGAIT